MYASIREQTVYEALPRRHVPERLTIPWIVSLIGVDAFATLAGCYVAGIPSTVGPAACVLVCAAMWACGAYQRSYAVAWRDEAYHVVVGTLVALPFWLLLNAIAAQPIGPAILGLALACIFMSAMHCALHVARHADDPPPYARAAFITPEAQWRAGHSTYRFAKQCADVGVSALLLVALSPLLLLVSVCIAIESGFPILFKQTRVGRSGKPFTIFKFRTMIRDAGTGWATPGDARITPFGAILRRCSIDELPQLLNIIRGDMSLVGPRPEMEEFAREFRRTIPHYEERHVLTPGVTGWAQVQLERNLEPRDMPNVVPYDLFYVENASIVLDAIVVVKTAAELVFHRAV